MRKRFLGVAAIAATAVCALGATNNASAAEVYYRNVQRGEYTSIKGEIFYLDFDGLKTKTYQSDEVEGGMYSGAAMALSTEIANQMKEEIGSHGIEGNEYHISNQNSNNETHEVEVGEDESYAEEVTEANRESFCQELYGAVESCPINIGDVIKQRYVDVHNVFSLKATTTIVTGLNFVFEKPKAGDEVKIINDSGDQDVEPVFTFNDESGIVNFYRHMYISGLDADDDNAFIPFEGTFEDGENYMVGISFESCDGPCVLSKNIKVKINGKEAEKVTKNGAFRDDVHYIASFRIGDEVDSPDTADAADAMPLYLVMLIGGVSTILSMYTAAKRR